MTIIALIALTAVAVASPVLTPLKISNPARLLAPPVGASRRIKPSALCASLACNHLLPQHHWIKTRTACPEGLGLAMGKGGICKAMKNDGESGFPELYINPALQLEIQTEYDEVVAKINKIFDVPSSTLEKFNQLVELMSKESKIETECLDRFNRLKKFLSPTEIAYLLMHLSLGATHQALRALLEASKENSNLMNDIDESKFQSAMLSEMQIAFSNLYLMKGQLNEFEANLPR
jgi:hypothetical protein